MTDPRDRLAAWLRWSGRSQASLADEIGCAQTFVSALIRKRKRLDSVHLALAVAEVTAAWPEGRITVGEWDGDQPIVDLEAAQEPHELPPTGTDR